MHGVEVVDKALHSLIGVPVCGFFRPTACPGNDLGSVLSGELEACAQCGGHSTVKGRSIAEPGVFTGGLAGGVDGLLNGFLGIVQIQLVLDCFGEAAAVGAKEGFCNALCHAVIKVRNGLAAVLVILIGLNGDGGQCGVACNALGFTEIAMSGGKTAMEQPDNINLTAGGGQRIKVKVVNVNVTFPICLGMLGAEEICFVIGLRPCCTDLEHGAHGGVAVDVGVIPLHVAGTGIDVGDLIDGLHERRVCFTGTGAVGPIENIGLGGGVEAVIHELLLNGVLNGLYIGGGGRIAGLQIGLHGSGDPGGVISSAFSAGFQRFQNSGNNFALLIEHHTAVPLYNALNHSSPSSFPYL